MSEGVSGPEEVIPRRLLHEAVDRGFSHANLSFRLLACPHDMTAGFLQTEWQSLDVFCDPAQRSHCVISATSYGS